MKTKTILLKCRKCGNTKRTPRCDIDPPEAEVMVTWCPKCNPDGFDDIDYLDKNGTTLPATGEVSQ